MLCVPHHLEHGHLARGQQRACGEWQAGTHAPLAGQALDLNGGVSHRLPLVWLLGADGRCRTPALGVAARGGSLLSQHLPLVWLLGADPFFHEGAGCIPLTSLPCLLLFNCLIFPLNNIPASLIAHLLEPSAAGPLRGRVAAGC
eukprot:365802-Chlamydomonas_euryale.AAC.14